jgi:predicted transcriptional regulator
MDKLYDMTTKTVTRSIRFDQDLNDKLELLAHAAHVTVSEYVRDIVAEAAARESRILGRQKAAAIFASLPQLDDPDAERVAMWGIGTGVPR